MNISGFYLIPLYWHSFIALFASYFMCKIGSIFKFLAPLSVVVCHALIVLVPFSSIAQSQTPFYTNDFSEKPSVFRSGSFRSIPSHTIETIRLQNEELKKRGRSVNMHSFTRSGSATNSSACGSCRQMGVENGWDVWQADQGQNYDSLGLNLTTLASPATPRFNITTGPGVDPLTPGVNPGDPPITLVAPPGFGSSSIQLGQPQTDGNGGGCSSRAGGLAAGCAERLTYCFTVGPTDTNFVYAYAFVMENPGDTSHTLLSMPYVEFMILDASGDTIPCAYQRFIASESFPGQYTCNAPRNGGGGGPGVLRDTALYKPWTVQGVNLSSFIGQTLTVVITNADCQLGGHFCHSYWDFNCGSSTAVVKPTCYANAPDTLIAPLSADTVNTYSYEWYRNNATVPFATTQMVTPYSVSGDTFTVKVILPSGCNWYARYVPQHFSVDADFTFSTSCGNAGFSQQAFSPSAEDPISYWSWSFDGGTPSSSTNANPGAVYFSPGNHAVTLIAGTYSPGCRDTVRYTLNVPQIPVASFNASNICAGGQISFTNSSTIAAGDTISSYFWSFQGGTPSTSTAANPVISYSGSGSFRVTLIVTSTRGCSDTVQRNITVFPLPIASFDASDVCFGNDVVVTNNSTVSSGSLIYSWSIQGGNPSNASIRNPVISYSSPGLYPISLIVQTANGCADTLIKNVSVHPQPQAVFSAPHACVGRAVTFDNRSLSASGDTISSVIWSFPGGNPATSSLFSPEVFFSNPDTATVQLIVTNQSGCDDTVAQSIIITPNPSASFIASSFCFGSSLTLQNTSTILPVGDTLYYQWSITSGSLSSSTETDPVASFSSPGSSAITLIASANGGCADTMQQTISVFPLPVAGVLPVQACFGRPVTIINNSTLSIGDSVQSYNWSFTNAGISASSQVNPTVTFSDLDSSTAQLIVTTIHGCQDTVRIVADVRPSPLADFTFIDVCAGDPVALNNSTTVLPGNYPINYSWLLPGSVDGGSFAEEPSTSYSLPGSYTISLIAQVPGGCGDTLQKQIRIHPFPVVSFEAPSACVGNNITMLNNSSIDLGDEISQFQWAFSDGSPAVSNLSAPQVRYDSAGTFPVQLIALSSAGCADTSQGFVLVHALPEVNINDPDSGCVPVCHLFRDRSVSFDGAITQWQWTLPGVDPGYSLVQDPGLICYDRPGNYGVSLLVATEFGCESRQTFPDRVKAFPLPQASYSISFEQTNVLSPVITFVDQSSADVVNRWWDFGDGTAVLNGTGLESHSYAGSVVNNDFHQFTTSLIVTNTYGCMDTAYRPLDINPDFAFYVPSAFTPNGDSKNSTFYAKSFGVKEYDISIFDRWGVQMWSCHQDGSNLPWDTFSSEGMSSSCQWDGMVSGRMVQQDVYVWKVRLTDVFGKQHSYLGSVTVYF